MLEINKVHCMDALEGLRQLDTESIHCCVTSPPYYNLRDYGVYPTIWPEVRYSPIVGVQDITVPEWVGCLGLEPTIEMFVGHIVLIFREVKRVLRKDGTLWLNFGDSYASSASNKHDEKYIDPANPRKGGHRCRTNELKPKNLLGIPWRIAFAMQADGWWLRSDIIWNKPSCLPESVRDRPTKCHEYIFLLAKSAKYYYDANVIKEPMAASSIIRLAQDIEGQTGSTRANGGAKTNGNMKAVQAKGNAKTFRGGGKYTKGKSFDNNTVVQRESHGNIPNETGLRNKRTVWTVPTAQFSDAHFSTFPSRLIRPAILAGCPAGGIVLDPFMGSGTTGMVAAQLQRNYIGFEMNPDYIRIADNRTQDVQLEILF
jgi:DNA modification methylase